MKDEHHDIRMLLGAFALDDVTDSERTSVQAHLDGCATCRAELAELQPLRDRLAMVDVDRLDETATVPSDLESLVFARIADARRAEATATPITEARSVRRRGLMALVASAAAVVGFAVAWNVRPEPPAGPLEAVAVRALDTELETLTANVVPHTWGMEVKLSGAGFRAGEVYAVNVVTGSGTLAPAGEFIGTGNNPMDCNLNSSVLREDATGFEVVDSTGAVVVSSTF